MKKPPYIIQCLMGKLSKDFKNLPRVSPLTASSGGRILSGKPPQGGVDDLVYEQISPKQGHMKYTYKGESYYIKYSPAEKENCYKFVTKTVTNKGVVKEVELCR